MMAMVDAAEDFRSISRACTIEKMGTRHGFWSHGADLPGEPSREEPNVGYANAQGRQQWEEGDEEGGGE